MIHFFRDILNGPLYIVVVIFSIIFIMAIIGFLMERKQLEKKHKEKIAVVDSTNSPVTPIEPILMEENVTSSSPEMDKPEVIQIVDEPYVVTDEEPVNTLDTNQ